MSGKPVVIVLHGPSGVGKDSVIELLHIRTGIRRATSSTTRAPRPDEEDGNDYHFLTTEEFKRKIDAGDFIEYALVYGDWKGLERSEIEVPLREGRDLIIRTDVQGARTWRQKLEGAVFIFLAGEKGDEPEAHRETLRYRLTSRGSEDDASLRLRLDALGVEIADMENNDYVVMNRHGRLSETAEEIAKIIESERHNPHRPIPRLIA